MPLDKAGGGVSVRGVQKLNGTFNNLNLVAGSITLTTALPAFQVSDPSNAFIENLWWRVTGGTMTALITVFADVTGVNQITLVISSPVAQTLSLQIGGTVKEYA